MKLKTSDHMHDASHGHMNNISMYYCKLLTKLHWVIIMISWRTNYT